MIALHGAVSYSELRDMPLPELDRLQEITAEVVNKMNG